MIPFEELCAALDRYNRRRQGLPEAAPPPAPQPAPMPVRGGWSTAPEPDYAAAGGDDEEPTMHLTGRDIPLTDEPTLHIAARTSRGDEGTSELDLDELQSIDNTDIADESDEQ